MIVGPVLLIIGMLCVAFACIAKAKLNVHKTVAMLFVSIGVVIMVFGFYYVYLNV
jgi:uncharacterized membrane protein